MRYAIWTAVSTETQASADKDSLPEQEKRCRASGQARGWTEVGVYSAPGASRTRYTDLSMAEREIPDLHRLLEDSKAGRLDLVAVYDYTRLRDLVDLVAKALNSYGVQLFSVNQPIEPIPPETYNPYATDSESMMRGMNQIISRWQISDLRRKHAFGMMGRVRRGLHPAGRAPYGYDLVDGALAVNPVEAAVLTTIKDQYLAGQTVPQLITQLRTQHTPAPNGANWSDYGLRYMLRNTVYCGVVRLGYTRKHNDPRAGKSKQVLGDPSKMLTGAGQHQALWDEATHKAILAEMKRRHRRNKGWRTYRLSNLLYCAEHDRALRIQYYGGLRDDAHRAWYCNQVPVHWHLAIKDADILQRLAAQLVVDLRSIGARLELPDEKEDTAPLVTARDDLQRRRERLTDALESGTLDARTYGDRVESLDLQIHSLQDRIAAADERAANSAQRAQNLSTIVEVIETTPEFLTDAPAQVVNQQLRTLIERVAVHDGTFEIHYR